MERHLQTQELLIFLNDGAFLTVALPGAQSDSTGRPMTRETEVIPIPRYAAVLFPVDAWHSAGFPLSQPFAEAYVIFQNDTSVDDIKIVDLSEEIITERG